MDMRTGKDHSSVRMNALGPVETALSTPSAR